jgi:FkbM family methyltransferase
MFLEALKKQLLIESSNYYSDNFDYYTFGKKKGLKKAAINQLKRLFFNRVALGIILNNKFLYRKFFLGYLFKWDKYIQPLEFFYDHLASQESKDLLIKLVSFRLLGYVKVRLPLSNPDYWNGIKEYENLKNENDSIDIKSFPWKLYLHDVSSKGFPLKVYLNSKAAFTTFSLQQYIKRGGDKVISPKAGDTVLDLGGCYGDTSIFFYHLMNRNGKVYIFEFIPGNLGVLRKNMAINQMSDAIKVVEHPLWNTSDKKIYFKDAGAGSRISFEKFEGYEGETTTLSVDDFVERHKIEKVNFIKTDIEGAEPEVLKGAINTLKKFTPTLAISIYHNMNDFTGIIRQIADLNLGYKFYLGHYTIYASETVLYAVKE